MIKRFFSPPHFEDDDLNTKAVFLNGVSWIAIVLLAAVLVADVATDFEYNTTIFLSVLIVTFALALFLLRHGFVNASGILAVSISWIGLSVQAYAADGVYDVVVIAYLIIAALAGLVINVRAALIVFLLSILAIWTLAILVTNGLITPLQDTPQNYARDLSIIFILVAVLVYFMTTSWQNALKRARSTALELGKSNEELQVLRLDLEQRIGERTAELNTVNQHNLRRAQQFQALAEISRALASVQELEALLLRITQLISAQFDFYHVGIFLLDESRSYAVLSASNSEGGRRMMAREHKLEVGRTGIVGYVTGTGIPRIALDTGADAVFFDNPDLPETRSELALPLSISGQIIGALDIQSTEPNAFSEEDVEVLTTLTDQVALAIQNAHSFRETRKLLAEAQSAISGYVQESWQALRPDTRPLGYQFSGSVIRPLEKPLEGTSIAEAMQKGETVKASGEGSNSSLTVPIRLRDQTIGVINLQSSPEHIWNPDQIDIAQAVAERLSLAIETATLIQATQHRANLERVTSEIAGKISSTTRFENILQTVAQELSRALGGSEVLVQIEPLAMELAASGEG